MQPNDSSVGAARYVSADQLHIGMYVHIDLPWFLHPFTRNDFKISTEEQIEKLRALGLPRIRYDPQCNEECSGEDGPAAFTGPVDLAVEEPSQHNVRSDPVLAKKEEGMRRLREQRQVVAQTEKAFTKATAIMRTVTGNDLLRPKESLYEMYGLVEQMAAVFLERPDVSLRVMGEKCGGEEAYFHGLNVCVLSLMLARKLNLSREQARVLAIGALLHDLGKIDIPGRVLKMDPREYTRLERELYASHVETGLRMGAQLGLVPEALDIVAQHHELADGSGYPRALSLEQIAPLARVVALVNVYDNLCNPVMLNQAMTPHEALSFIFARRRDEFDARVLQFMIRSLGVYPPGSIVKLSTNAIATVVSVNPQNVLRPWIMLYEPGVPKHEGILLDLEQETGMSIVKNLQPAMLPPTVYAYLSPRRRITYFFDSESPSPEGRA